MTERVEAPVNWGRRTVIVLSVTGLVILAGFLASVTVPRWWAHRIGAQVDGSITQGTLVGLFYGFFFTLLPLLAFVAIVRWRHTVKTVAIALVVAVVLALPNLMTLGIVLGRSNASHAGERTLDVDAPAFRWASLAGALLAAFLGAFVLQLLITRKRARERARTARDELERARMSEPPVDPLPDEPPLDEPPMAEPPAGAA